MTVEIAASGRLAGDPQERETSSGKPMVIASLAIDGTPGTASEESPQCIRIVCVGRRTCETLSQHRMGDFVHIVGPASWRTWTGKDGQERSGWTVDVKNLLSARKVYRRPRSAKYARSESNPRQGDTMPT